MMKFKKPHLLPLIAMLCTTVFLAGLGLWQLQRLSQKEQMIASIESAGSAPVLGTLPVDDGQLKELEYRKVMLEGNWLPLPPLHMIGQQNGGFVMYAPLQLEDSDQVVLVSLGWFPEHVKIDLPVLPVKGYLRLPRPKRMFAPQNLPEKNIWFAEDIAAMSQAVNKPLQPVIIETKAIPALRNNHLGYALTWFTLALMCVGMFLWGHRKKA